MNDAVKKIHRRTIVKGAAWSIPVIAAATAVPGAIASTPTTTYTVTATGSGTNSKTCSFVLPAGATNISYVVTGGGGGGFLGAAGAELTGTLSSPVADTPIQLIAAGGGLWGGANFTENGGSPVQPREGLGGEGFGNGGSAPLPAGALDGYPANAVRIAGGGGGGSALLIGGVAAVVAGGGGGGGVRDGSYSVKLDGNGAEKATDGAGGSGATSVAGAAPNGGDTVIEIRQDGQGPVLRSVTALGGAGGSGAAGGAGGSWTSFGTDFTTAPNGLSGGNGTLGSPSAGGNGGDGVVTSLSGQTWAPKVTLTISSGGGGGGFSGGGGGGAANAAKFGYDSSLVGGAGGGGSNYVGNAGGILVTNDSVTTADNGAGAHVVVAGGPGTVTITFTAAPGLTFGC
ncbi:hypothetical protein SAMN04488591_3282 [Microbacterium azadirachtae]|uniref:Glycine rich protein n=1 Tax=Microbacterium azadirachtae TaxID=582680 RepID=A0A1I6J3L6_9MICO|nr:hypothetical protein [Microbacterium azadirachtae]SFR73517.1 hypothetical protein SAMN04488591_3282 [Microbacterium azadirachtae]